MYIFTNGILNTCRQVTVESRRLTSKWKLAPFYHVLRARPTSSADEIRESYIKLTKMYHPDNLKNGDQLKFIRIKEAYEKIKDAPLKMKKDEVDAEEDLSHAAFIRRRAVFDPKNLGPYAKCDVKLYGN